MDWFSITAQCLTPIGDPYQISKTSGLYQRFVTAKSLEDAVFTTMEIIAQPYKGTAFTAMLNYDKHTVTVLDESGHIVNFYWGFVGHRA